MIGAEYLNPILFPPGLQTQRAVQLTATAMIFFLLFINYLGIKTGAWAQNVLTLVKIAMIFLLVFVALRYRGLPPENLTGEAAFRPWWIALSTGLISVFYTYGGYQCTINFGADVRGGARNMPRAIFAGIIIILCCYLLINVAYVKILGTTGVAEAKLVAAEVARVCFGKFGYLFVSLAIFLSAMGFLNVSLLQIPRAYYAMAEDRALPPIFKRVNTRTQVQELALLFFGATILLSIYLLGTFENLVNYVMFIDALNLAVVASTIFVLRRRAAENASYSGFRVPFYPILPGVFVLFLLGISVSVLLTQTRSALFGAAILIAGYPIFLLLKRVISRSP